MKVLSCVNGVKVKRETLLRPMISKGSFDCSSRKAKSEN